MRGAKKTLETFAANLVRDNIRQRIDPITLNLAREWYKGFAGNHAVKMDDTELVDIYKSLH